MLPAAQARKTSEELLVRTVGNIRNAKSQNGVPITISIKFSQCFFGLQIIRSTTAIGKGTIRISSFGTGTGGNVSLRSPRPFHKSREKVIWTQQNGFALPPAATLRRPVTGASICKLNQLDSLPDEIFVKPRRWSTLG